MLLHRNALLNFQAARAYQSNRQLPQGDDHIYRLGAALTTSAFGSTWQFALSLDGATPRPGVRWMTVRFFALPAAQDDAIAILGK
ncbi:MULTISPECIES: hypothetical protein [Bradyrhizobium]|uniref:hypothetical protein n=1 Tax=Bradyrhizobium TaxID=374 RepID=UPI001EDA23E4|nr:hypothetical protein [Bradyrhizobium zhengyangense]MCG2645319.1 hypothetical protein [Bradyrhizobium zhengyangense]